MSQALKLQNPEILEASLRRQATIKQAIGSLEALKDLAPEKVAGLQAAGIEVVERLPIILPANPHNERYLATKRDRTGHQL